MKLYETDHGTVIDIRVKPNSKQFQVNIEDKEIVVFYRESPVKGRANRERARFPYTVFILVLVSGYKLENGGDEENA